MLKDNLFIPVFVKTSSHITKPQGVSPPKHLMQQCQRFQGGRGWSVFINDGRRSQGMFWEHFGLQVITGPVFLCRTPAVRAREPRDVDFTKTLASGSFASCQQLKQLKHEWPLKMDRMESLLGTKWNLACAQSVTPRAKAVSAWLHTPRTKLTLCLRTSTEDHLCCHAVFTLLISQPANQAYKYRF